MKMEELGDILDSLNLKVTKATITLELERAENKPPVVEPPIEPPIDPPVEPPIEPPIDPEPTNKTVVWTQDFENTAIQSPYSEGQVEKDFPWLTYKNGRNSYIDTNEHISVVEKDGKTVMKHSYPAGHWGVGTEWNNPDGGTGVNIFSVMNATSGWDELYLSYNVFFEDGFDWGLGGKLPGFCSIPSPHGLDGPEPDEGTMAIMMWQPDGKLKFYCYFHEDFDYQYGRGPVIPSVLETGKWFNITVRLVNSSPWDKDGLMEIFVNGVLDMTWNHIQTREKSEIMLNTIAFNTFQGGGDKSYAPDVDGTALFDGIEVFYLTGESTPETPIGKVASQPGRDISEYLTYWNKV